MQLYLTIAGVSHFYLSNIHTLSVIFGRQLTDADETAERRRHAAEAVLGHLRPEARHVAEKAE